MKRDYDSGTTDGNITFFVGTEIEHSPAFGMKTLFVTGIQNPEEVRLLALEHEATHIYLGANQSFVLTGKYGTSVEQGGWDDMVYQLLDANFWVTLDFDIRYVEWILESGYTERERFIPMISAKLPYIDQLGYNACLKLDDKDFRASNPGVWVHNVHDLMSRDKFTNWDKYGVDTIIK